MQESEVNCYGKVTYEVAVTDTTNASEVRSGSTEDLFIEFTDLDPYRSYSINVTSKNDGGHEVTSNPQSYKTMELGNLFSCHTNTKLF
jgi:hypothetical protein